MLIFLTFAYNSLMTSFTRSQIYKSIVVQTISNFQSSGFSVKAINPSGLELKRRKHYLS